jgi:hypothetical protein
MRLVASKVEVLRMDAAWTVEDRGEHVLSVAVLEEAEEGRLPVVCILAEEPGVSDEASQALADRGGVQEGGWLRPETD